MGCNYTPSDARATDRKKEEGLHVETERESLAANRGRERQAGMIDNLISSYSMREFRALFAYLDIFVSIKFN